jgi:hypothetical protein
VRLKYVIGILFLGLLTTSFPLGYIAYSVDLPNPFNFYETLASFMFWFPLVSLALLFPLRSAAKLFIRNFRTVHGKLLFGSYASIHLILYGFLLELILDNIHKYSGVAFQSSVYFSSTALYPASFSSIITSFGLYPSISILVPPSFDLALSLYSFSFALIIAILVVTNATQVAELGNVCAFGQKTRAFVLLPAIAVIAGASCCLSFPALVSLAAPGAAFLSNSSAIFYVAYFAFPCATAIALKYNLDSTRRMASDLEKLKQSLLNSALEGSVA